MSESTRSTTSRSKIQIATGELLRWSIAVLLAVMLIDTWCLGGLLAPLIVVSESMAPTLRGPHAQWDCAECGRSFTCEIESITHRRDTQCPHCGAPADQQAARIVSGDRVLVDRAAYAWRAPERFEIVVAQNPDDPRTLCVKRVVGLPGESLRMAGGDLWHDGHLMPRIARDVYYTTGELSAQLADDEYYLLGDNSSQSRDSRDWSAVPANSIIGRAMHW